MYTVDEGLHGRNVLQSVSIESATDILYMLKINSSHKECQAGTLICSSLTLGVKRRFRCGY